MRKLAVEAFDNGLLAPELANDITRVKGVASKGVRLGTWLATKQAQALLNTPDATTKKATGPSLAVLLGCWVRRSEVAALTFKRIQQRHGRWCIVDLIGKHGRVRTVPMPAWRKVAIDAWGRCRRDSRRPDVPTRQSRLRSPGHSIVREGGLAAHPALRGGRGRCWNRAPRLSPHVREVMPGCRRGVGADSDSARARLGPDNRAIPWHESRIWCMLRTMGSSDG